MPLKGAKKLKVALGGLKQAANDDLRRIVFTGFREIDKLTPVDTGRARSNWFLSQGTPSTSKTKSTGGSDINMPKQIIGMKTYLTNNLPYIQKLEYGGYSQPGTDKTVGGFSIQAPKGWVRAAVIRMQNKIRAL